MFEKLLSYYQIEDLRRETLNDRLSRSSHDRRSDFIIAVIDDRPFEYEQNLRALGYKIEVFHDIRTISEVDPYSIILCDLQGVGKYLDSKGQGAFIINEIKRNSPDKFVIAYTGGSSDDAITLRAQDYADYLEKRSRNRGLARPLR